MPAANAVADLSPLADLVSLRRLDLGCNAAADASPLGDLGTLVWLRWLWRLGAGECLGCYGETDR